LPFNLVLFGRKLLVQVRDVGLCDELVLGAVNPEFGEEAYVVEEIGLVSLVRKPNL
jgi:hypothetical protein